MRTARYLGKLLVTLAVTVALVSPTAAFGWIGDEDQNDLSPDEIASAIANGEVSGEDDQNQDQPQTLSARSSYAVTTVSGENRYTTSIAEMQASFSSASTVIIAGGERYADSIAGSSLAGSLNAPLLLTTPNSLLSETSNAIKRLGAKNIIVLGGAQTVSETVVNQLKGIVGSSNVTRLAGTDRYGTQMTIYQYGIDHKLWSGTHAIVASGETFADALSVSPLAYQLKAPIFFADASKTLPAAQKDALKLAGASTVLVIGGTASVSAGTGDTIKTFAKAVRLSGATRYDTSRDINDYAVANHDFSWDRVAFASGQNPWDSLGGGSMQGKNKRLLSLLDNQGPKTTPDVKVAGKPAHVQFIGGRNTYSNAFKAQVAYRLGYKLTDVQGMKIYLDAGHGQDSNGTGAGLDPGAYGNGKYEYQLTGDLADRVANALRNTYGLEVYVNKSGWYKLRQTQASLLDCGVLVSIHFNAAGGHGTESYIHTYNAAYGSKTLQHAITPGLASTVGRGNRGEGRMQLAVCSGKLPATLLEICFIDNAGDMQAYWARRDNIAQSIANGIANS